MLKAIELGKHVVTANKALLAKHGTEIFAAPRRRARRRLEASVSGRHPYDQGASARGFRPIASSGSRASSTAPATTSSRRCATRCCPSTWRSPRRNAWATPRPIRVRRRGHRRRAQAHDPCRRSPSAFRCSSRSALHRRDLQAHRRRHHVRRGPGLPHQAPRHHAPHAEGIELRVTRRSFRRGA